MTAAPVTPTDACPFCGVLGTAVRDSRSVRGEPTWRRRRRLCVNPECARQFFTLEVPEHIVIEQARILRQLDAALETSMAALLEVRGHLSRARRPIGDEDDPCL